MALSSLIPASSIWFLYRMRPEAAPNPAVTPGTSPSAMETTNSLLAPRVTPQGFARPGL